MLTRPRSSNYLDGVPDPGKKWRNPKCLVNFESMAKTQPHCSHSKFIAARAWPSDFHSIDFYNLPCVFPQWRQPDAKIWGPVFGSLTRFRDYVERILSTLEMASPNLTKRHQLVFIGPAVVKASLVSYQQVPPRSWRLKQKWTDVARLVSPSRGMRSMTQPHLSYGSRSCSGSYDVFPSWALAAGTSARKASLADTVPPSFKR